MGPPRLSIPSSGLLKQHDLYLLEDKWGFFLVPCVSVLVVIKTDHGRYMGALRTRYTFSP